MIRQISTLFSAIWMVTVAVGCATPPTTITTNPSGAFVTVNGVGAGPAPVTYTFDYGKQPAYVVKASKSGFFDSSITLVNGVAAFSPTTPLAVGTHSIVATYGGDTNFIANAVGATVSQTIDPVGTTISLAASADPSAVGAPVTFTATVAANPPSSSA